MGDVELLTLTPLILRQVTFSTMVANAIRQMAVSTYAFESLHDILIQKRKSYTSVTLSNCFCTVCQKKNHSKVILDTSV